MGLVDTVKSAMLGSERVQRFLVERLERKGLPDVRYEGDGFSTTDYRGARSVVTYEQTDGDRTDLRIRFSRDVHVGPFVFGVYSREKEEATPDMDLIASIEGVPADSDAKPTFIDGAPIEQIIAGYRLRGVRSDLLELAEKQATERKAIFGMRYAQNVEEARLMRELPNISRLKGVYVPGASG